ncbi:MAG: hypothetical protein AAFV36_07205 [Myxococcota bacterium]
MPSLPASGAPRPSSSPDGLSLLTPEERPGATADLPIESVIEQTLDVIDDGAGQGVDKKMRALSELYHDSRGNPSAQQSVLEATVDVFERDLPELASAVAQSDTETFDLMSQVLQMLRTGDAEAVIEALETLEAVMLREADPANTRSGDTRPTREQVVSDLSSEQPIDALVETARTTRQTSEPKTRAETEPVEGSGAGSAELVASGQRLTRQQINALELDQLSLDDALKELSTTNPGLLGRIFREAAALEPSDIVDKSFDGAASELGLELKGSPIGDKDQNVSELVRARGYNQYMSGRPDTEAIAQILFSEPQRLQAVVDHFNAERQRMGGALYELANPATIEEVTASGQRALEASVSAHAELEHDAAIEALELPDGIDLSNIKLDAPTNAAPVEPTVGLEDSGNGVNYRRTASALRENAERRPVTQDVEAHVRELARGFAADPESPGYLTDAQADYLAASLLAVPYVSENEILSPIGHAQISAELVNAALDGFADAGVDDDAIELMGAQMGQVAWANANSVYADSTVPGNGREALEPLMRSSIQDNGYGFPRLTGPLPSDAAPATHEQNRDFGFVPGTDIRVELLDAPQPDLIAGEATVSQVQISSDSNSLPPPLIVADAARRNGFSGEKLYRKYEFSEGDNGAIEVRVSDGTVSWLEGVDDGESSIRVEWDDPEISEVAREADGSVIVDVAFMVDSATEGQAYSWGLNTGRGENYSRILTSQHEV